MPPQSDSGGCSRIRRTGNCDSAKSDCGSTSRGIRPSAGRSSLRDMTLRPTREEVVLALAGLGWVMVWLWPQPLAAALVAAGCGLGLVMSRRRPELAAALVLCADVLAVVLGVSTENPGTLFPVAVVVYGLGRWAGRWAAVLGLLGFLVPVAWVDPPSIPPTLVFGVVLYGCFWGFGRMVAAKSARAEAARQRAARVGDQDPRAIADAVVAEERARLASDIAGVVGDSVGSMVSDAELAVRELDPVVIERIRLRGTTAVTELRRMLGLLRQSHEPVTPDASEPRWRPWASYALPAALLLTAGAIVLVTWLLPAPVSLLTAPLIVLLSWLTGADGRRVAWLSWLVLAVTSVLVTLLVEPDNAAMQVVMIVLPAWAGHAWSESDRAQRSAQQATTQAQSELDRAVAEAVGQERLRVARDLHDVTSHALGVMVLQSGAANAQRVTDPARARASLAVVADAGRRALADLDRLIGLIDAGVLGAVAVDEPVELPERLTALADRIRQTGARIALTVQRSPNDPETVQVVYRIAQEALTNAVRYAPGSAIDALVEGTDTGCRISVVDDGGHLADQVAVPTERHGTGFGLVGAAERVGALGGEFTAGPEPLGGWAVRAWIPARVGAGQAQAGAAS